MSASAFTPDLETIAATPDVGVRFFAIVGAAVSLAAEAEVEMFGLYMLASGLDQATAADEFYRQVRFAHKRDTLSLAVTHAIVGRPMASEWPAVLEAINRTGGDGTARNLVSHNVVRHVSRIVVEGEGAGVHELFSVAQNEHQVAAGRRPGQTADFDSLLAYCRTVLRCIIQIQRFRRALSPE